MNQDTRGFGISFDEEQKGKKRVTEAVCWKIWKRGRSEKQQGVSDITLTPSPRFYEKMVGTVFLRKPPSPTECCTEGQAGTHAHALAHSHSHTHAHTHPLTHSHMHTHIWF